MVTKPARVIAYYVAVIAGAVIVHQAFLAEILGGNAADLLRRNSEAYALMVLVPMFWDLFGPATGPSLLQGPRSGTERSGSQGLWFSLLALGSVVLESQPEGWPTSITTLGEAFVGAFFITA